MNLFLLISFFILGAIIGSFLNVILYRYNTGRGIGGRSMCFSCRRKLTPVDLVPILSFLAFRGRCRTCKSKISWQYPLVELLTAVLFAGSFWYFAGATGGDISAVIFNPKIFSVQMTYILIVMSSLVLITVYDLRHKIIPDLFAFVFAGTTLLGQFILFDRFGDISIVLPSAINFASGIIIAFPFYLMWRVSDGRWMGLGDAKLALGIGWFLGLVRGFTAVIFGFWIGAVISIILLALGTVSRRFKNVTMKSELPFAPFLVAGLLIVFFFGYNVFDVLAFIS